MNILVINQPLNNRGDESAHRAILRKLCSAMPEVHVKVVFVGANQNSVDQFNVRLPQVEYLNIKRIKATSRIAEFGLVYGMKWIWNMHPTIAKLIKLYRQSDLILCAPGGICMGGFQNWWHLFLLHLAKYVGKPLVYYGRSFGPFPTETKRNRLFKTLSMEMLKYFSFLSIRDKKTEMLADQLGIKYYSTVDSAFLDAPKASIPNELKSMVGKKPYVVMVPNQLNWHFAYRDVSDDVLLDFYSNIANMLAKRFPNHNILMLPQTFNCGVWRDLHFFNRIKNLNPLLPLLPIPDIYSSDIQQTVIAGAEFVVGARYHSIVFAINNAVPFVSLSYEHKMSGLLKTIGSEDLMVDISSVFQSKGDMENALQSINVILNREQSVKPLQIQAKQICENCFDKFKEYCKTK